jgi:hypothetical protein
MAKHMLRVRQYKIMTGPTMDVVHLCCENCPRFFQISHRAMYDILVNKSRVLIADVNSGAVKEWVVCEPRNDYRPNC